MRITFISPPSDLSGGARVIAIYAQGLQTRGHEVTVVSPPEKPLTALEKLRSFRRSGRWPKYSARPSHLDQTTVPRQVLERHRAVVDDDVSDGDIVIATWWETAEWVAALSKSKGAKIYFIQHHEVFDYLPVERVKATWRLPLHKIVISRWLRHLAESKYGDSAATLIPNGVDMTQFNAPPRRRQAVPTVGLLYSSTPWKGVSLSLDAIERAKQRFPDLRVIAFGAEPISPRLPLPANSTYFQSPPQHAIKEIYASCDVWLCGSESEGFYLPLLEAMACRCPVVSTEVGGPADIIEPGSNGYLAPVGDMSALARYLVHVLGLGEDDWRRMSDAALSTATRYTWDDAVERFERALYAEVGAARANSTASAGMNPHTDPI